LRSRVYFLIARLIPGLLGLATTATLTRMLSPAEYGLYALGLSIVFLLTMGTFEWLGLSVLRMAPTTKAPDAFFGTVVTCFTIIFLVCVVVASLVVVVGGFADYAMLITASLVAAFMSAWVELKQRLQMAELREATFFRTSVLRGAATTLFVCGTAYLREGASSLLFAVGAAGLLVSTVVPEPRLTLLSQRFDLTVFRSLMRFGIPLSISVGLGTLLMSVDKWMLQAMVGPHAVGLFTAATLITQVPIMTLAGCIGPWAYSMAVQSMEFGSADVTSKQLERNLIFMLVIVIPATAGIAAVSGNLAHLLIGELYWGSAVRLAPWLAFTAAISSVRAFYVDVAFQLGHRTSPLIWTSLLAVSVNVGMDYWLIPGMGQLGAAVGSCTAVSVSFVIASIVSRRVFRLPLPLVDIIKIFASATIMLLVLSRLWDKTGLLALILQVGIGASVYYIAIISFNVMSVRARHEQVLRYIRRAASASAK
jgi:O-antigen/teichoic acid export membrane protein